MKLKLTFLLFLTSLICLGEVIPVGSGQSITDALNRSKPGDIIQLTGNNTLSTDAYLKLSQHIVGINNPTITVTGGNGFIAKSQSIEPGNHVFKGFRLIAASRGSPFGITVTNRSNVQIEGLHVEGFGQVGYKIGTEGIEGAITDIRITNCSVKNSAYEGSDQSLGNLTFYGSISNSLVEDFNIENTGPDSGYGIKARPIWIGSREIPSTHKNVKYNRIKQVGKAEAKWAGGLAANFFLEYWHVGGDGVEIANVTATNCLSLEYNAPYTSPYSFWVHHTNISIPAGGVGEFACSGILFEYNTVDFTNNKNPWNVFGEFNSGNAADPRVKGQPLKNIIVRYNVFKLANYSPSIFVLTTRFDGITFSYNTVEGTGNPLLVELRRTSSNGSTGFRAEGNRIDKFRTVVFAEGAVSTTLTNQTFAQNSLQSAGATVQEPKPPIVVSPPVIADPSDGKFFTGYNFNGNPIVVDGNLWSNKNFTTNGIWFKWTTTPSPTPINDEYKAMIQSSIYKNPLQVTLNSIPNGTYMVYVYVNEDNAPGPINLDINGVRMVTGFKLEKAGSWKRLGPYNASVTAGKIDITGSGSDVNFSAVTLYQAVETAPGTPATMWVPYEKDPRYEYQIRLKQ